MGKLLSRYNKLLNGKVFIAAHDAGKDMLSKKFEDGVIFDKKHRGLMPTCGLKYFFRAER